jgi:hypothetical protein
MEEERIVRRRLRKPLTPARIAAMRKQTSASAQIIAAMRPLKLTSGESHHRLQQIQVFGAEDHIVLTITTARGTINVPMGRKTAAVLAFQITKRLADLPPAKD